jgi:hypothetical protein
MHIQQRLEPVRGHVFERGVADDAGAADHGDLVVEPHVVAHQVTGSSFMP